MNTDKPVTVLLADDHALVRAGITLLLEELENVQVVGEATDGHEAMSLIRSLHPAVVLMDISMKGLNGLEATRQITKEFPDIRVIILSMHSTEEYVLQALGAGASGYLIKDSATVELGLAIAAVMRDERYLSPPVSRPVIDGYLDRLDQTREPVDVLTSRQRQVLQLIAEGSPTKEIAARLHVSVKTVESHRAQVMARLKIYDIAGLVRYAIRTGIVDSEE